MKKLISLILTFIMVLTIGVASFAEEGDGTGDGTVNLTDVRNVDTATYDQEETIKIESEEIPQGAPDISAGIVEIEEQSIPAGLPNTGGIPAEAFYVAGALFVVAALILALKKDRAGQKN